jgi:hypothetical protein
MLEDRGYHLISEQAGGYLVISLEVRIEVRGEREVNSSSCEVIGVWCGGREERGSR